MRREGREGDVLLSRYELDPTNLAKLFLAEIVYLWGKDVLGMYIDSPLITGTYSANKESRMKST